MKDRLFYFGFFLSCVVHLAVIRNMAANPAVPTPKRSQTLEVTYQRVKSASTKKEPTPPPKAEVIKEKKVVKPKNIKLLKRSQEQFAVFDKEVKDISKFAKKVSLDKKLTPKIKTLDLDRKMSVDLFRSEKITNPNYVSYSETTLQRIRRKAFENIDPDVLEEGQVYITFVLNSSGGLQKVQIIEEKTKASEYLRQVGIRSVKESAPFTNFPKGLSYPELTFSIGISFKVTEFNAEQ